MVIVTPINIQGLERQLVHIERVIVCIGPSATSNTSPPDTNLLGFPEAVGFTGLILCAMCWFCRKSPPKDQVQILARPQNMKFDINTRNLDMG